MKKTTDGRTRKYLPAGDGRYSADCLTGATDPEFSLSSENILRTTVTLDKYTFEVVNVSKWNSRRRTATVTFRLRPIHAGQQPVEYRIRFDRKWQWKQFHDNDLSAYCANARREIEPSTELDVLVSTAHNKIEAIVVIRKATGMGLLAAKRYVDARWGRQPVTPATPQGVTEADVIRAKGIGVLLEFPQSEGGK